MLRTKPAPSQSISRSFLGVPPYHGMHTFRRRRMTFNCIYLILLNTVPLDEIRKSSLGVVTVW